MVAMYRARTLLRSWEKEIGFVSDMLDNRVKFNGLYQLPQEQVEGKHRRGHLEVVGDAVDDGSSRDFNLLAQIAEHAMEAAQNPRLAML